MSKNLKCQEKISYCPSSLFSRSLCAVVNLNKQAPLIYLRKLNLPLNDKTQNILVSIREEVTRKSTSNGWHCRNTNRSWFRIKKSYKCTEKDLLHKDHRLIFEGKTFIKSFVDDPYIKKHD